MHLHDQMLSVAGVFATTLCSVILFVFYFVIVGVMFFFFPLGWHICINCHATFDGLSVTIRILISLTQSLNYCI